MRGTRAALAALVLTAVPAAAQSARPVRVAAAAAEFDPFASPMAPRADRDAASTPAGPTYAEPGEVTSTITGAAAVATIRDPAGQLTVVVPGDALGVWRVAGIDEQGVSLELQLPGSPRQRYLWVHRGGHTKSGPAAPERMAAPSHGLLLPGEIPTLLLPPSTTATAQVERRN